MSDVVMARLAALEARVAALESGGTKASSGGSNAGGGDTLPADMLTKPWSDKRVAKTPSNWSGRDVVGLKYSELTADEATQLSGFFEWKAKKGREENPPRVNRNGKPWHESDAFEAKLLRTWAKHGESRPSPTRYGGSNSGFGASAKHSAPPEPDPFDNKGDAFDDGEIPF